MDETLALLQAALAGRYEVERELGQGGMALVYLVHDLRHERRVALKILRPEMATAVGAERFLREVRIASQLRHPNILPLLDSGSADTGVGASLPYYVMPLASGETLRTRLDREGRLPPAEAVALIRQVALALAYAHREGVVHRDIKPDNIFLEDGQAVVADFGIARAVSVAGGDRLTSTGLAIGTPAYMSPEQLLGQPDIDGRTDQYSLACVLLELLTGRPPLLGSTVQAALARRMTQPPGLVAQRPAELPLPLAEVLDRAMAPAPDDRYTSSAEFADALDRAVSGVMPALARTAKPGIGNWVVGAALLAVAAAGAALLARGAGESGAPGSGSLVLAVLPFEVRGGPDFKYLGAGLVDLLSTTLDGAAGLSTVDPRAALKAAGESPLDREAAGEAARRAGAGLFVLGDVLEAGGRLRVTAALYRAGEAEPVTRASAQGRPEGLFELVDTLTIRLLSGWGEADPRVSGLAARTTSSLPALKAYLDGEAALRELRFGAGLEAYQRAVEADSAFALAWYRLSIAAEWLVRSDLAHDAAERAVRFAHRLPARDSLLLQAMLAGRLGEIDVAEPIYRRLLATRPEDIEAWLQLGEMLFHYGPVRGRPADDAREAWRRVEELEPELVSPIVHLSRLAARAGRWAELDSLRLALEAVRAGDTAALQDRGDLLEVETLQAFATGDTAAQGRSLAALRLSTDLTVVLTLWVVSSFTDDLPGAVRIADILAARGRSEPVRAVGEVLAGSIEMGRGRWREAQRRFAAADALHPPLGAQLAAFHAVAPFRPAPDPRAAALARALPDPARADTSPAHLDAGGYFTIPFRAPGAIREYLRGLEAASRGDAAAALAAAERLERLPSPVGSPSTGALASGIRAEEAWQAGRAEEAYATLLEAPSPAWYLDAVASLFVSGARERWRAAEALERLGRPEEAAARFTTFSNYSTYELPFQAPAERRLALLAERAGDPAAAARHWARFVALWQDADPELQPLVAEARARLQPPTGTPMSPSR